jgi:hypothetical protein
MRTAWILLGAVLIGSAAHAKAPACHSPFSFDANPKFDLSDVASITDEGKIYLDDELFIEIRRFDYDTGPVRGGKIAIALVYGGPVGDSGEVIGGMVSSTVEAYFDETRSKALNKKSKKDGFYAVFSIGNPENACQAKSYVVHLDRAGAFYANGVKTGQLQ